MVNFNYFEYFSKALAAWPSMGLTRGPLVSADQPASKLILQAHKTVHERYRLWRTSMPSYLGNQCMEVTTRLYVLLNHAGIKADIAIGAVRTDEIELYHCNLPYLQELASQPVDETTPIDLHAWITLGGDSVIDFALPSCLAKNYAASADLIDQGFCADATGMASHMGLYYEPLIVGSQYLARVNSADPHAALQQLSSLVQ